MTHKRFHFTPLLCLRILLCGVFVFSNVLFVYSAESSFWAERRKAAQKFQKNSSHSISKNNHPSPLSSQKHKLLAQLPQASHVNFGVDNTSVGSGIQSTNNMPQGVLPQSFSSSKEAHSWLSSLILPYGHIRDIHLSPSPDAPLIIHIQDAHGIEEAQKNIASMIQELKEKRGIGLVGVEGAHGAFNIEPLRDFPEDSVTKDIADYFLKKGRIGGPEYVGFTSPEPPVLWGIEDVPLYLANIQSLKNSMKQKSILTTRLDQFTLQSKNLKQKIYSKELTEFDRHYRAYQKHEEGLGKYVAYLANRNLKLEMSNWEKQYSNINLLTKALKHEKTLDFKVVEKERVRLVEVMVKKMSKEKLDLLVQNSLYYRMGQMSYGNYHQFLKTLCAQNRINLKNFGQLNSYIDYVLLAEKIDRNALLDELNELEKNTQDSLVQTPEQKKLVSVNRHLTLLNKLASHNMTPNDWMQYDKHRQEVLRAASELSALDKRGGEKNKSDGDIVGQGFGPDQKASPPLAADHQPLTTLIRPFENFCRYASHRNSALTDNLLLKMKQEKANASVMIAGGFHTHGLTQILRNKGASYVVVTPKITEIPKDHNYLDVFARDPLPLEKLFAGEKISMVYPLSTVHDPVSSDYQPDHHDLGTQCIFFQSLLNTITMRVNQLWNKQAEEDLETIAKERAGRFGLPVASCDIKSVGAKTAKQTLITQQGNSISAAASAVLSAPALARRAGMANPAIESRIGKVNVIIGQVQKTLNAWMAKAWGFFKRTGSFYGQISTPLPLSLAKHRRITLGAAVGSIILVVSSFFGGHNLTPFLEGGLILLLLLTVSTGSVWGLIALFLRQTVKSSNTFNRDDWVASYVSTWASLPGKPKVRFSQTSEAADRVAEYLPNEEVIKLSPLFLAQWQSHKMNWLKRLLLAHALAWEGWRHRFSSSRFSLFKNRSIQDFLLFLIKPVFLMHFMFQRMTDQSAKKIKLGFTPANVPDQFPVFVRMCAYGARHIYSQPWREVRRGMRRDGRIQTPDGWITAVDSRYHRDFQESTTITAIGNNGEMVEVRRICEPVESSSLTKDDIASLYASGGLIDRAMACIAPFALSGSTKVPLELQEKLEIINIDGPKITLRYQDQKSGYVVLYHPLDEIDEGDARGRSFKQEIFDPNGKRLGVIKGKTLIEFTPPARATTWQSDILGMIIFFTSATLMIAKWFLFDGSAAWAIGGVLIALMVRPLTSILVAPLNEIKLFEDTLQAIENAHDGNKGIRSPAMWIQEQQKTAEEKAATFLTRLIPGAPLLAMAGGSTMAAAVPSSGVLPMLAGRATQVAMHSFQNMVYYGVRFGLLSKEKAKTILGFVPARATTDSQEDIPSVPVDVSGMPVVVCWKKGIGFAEPDEHNIARVLVGDAVILDINTVKKTVSLVNLPDEKKTLTSDEMSLPLNNPVPFGRSSKNDLHIGHKRVSGMHGSLLLTENGILVQDGHEGKFSTNSTYPMIDESTAMASEEKHDLQTHATKVIEKLSERDKERLASVLLDSSFFQNEQTSLNNDILFNILKILDSHHIKNPDVLIKGLRSQRADVFRYFLISTIAQLNRTPETAESFKHLRDFLLQKLDDPASLGQTPTISKSLLADLLGYIGELDMAVSLKEESDLISDDLPAAVLVQVRQREEKQHSLKPIPEERHSAKALFPDIGWLDKKTYQEYENIRSEEEQWLAAANDVFEIGRTLLLPHEDESENFLENKESLILKWKELHDFLSSLNDDGQRLFLYVFFGYYSQLETLVTKKDIVHLPALFAWLVGLIEDSPYPEKHIDLLKKLTDRNNLGFVKTLDTALAEENQLTSPWFADSEQEVSFARKSHKGSSKAFAIPDSALKKTLGLLEKFTQAPSAFLESLDNIPRSGVPPKILLADLSENTRYDRTRVKTWPLPDKSRLVSKRIHPLKTFYPEEEWVLAERLRPLVQSLSHDELVFDVQQFVGIVSDQENFYLLSHQEDGFDAEFILEKRDKNYDLEKVRKGVRRLQMRVGGFHADLKKRNIVVTVLPDDRYKFTLIDFETDSLALENASVFGPWTETIARDYYQSAVADFRAEFGLSDPAMDLVFSKLFHEGFHFDKVAEIVRRFDTNADVIPELDSLDLEKGEGWVDSYVFDILDEIEHTMSPETASLLSPLGIQKNEYKAFVSFLKKVRRKRKKRETFISRLFEIQTFLKQLSQWDYANRFPPEANFYRGISDEEEHVSLEKGVAQVNNRYFTPEKKIAHGYAHHSLITARIPVEAVQASGWVYHIEKKQKDEEFELLIAGHIDVKEIDTLLPQENVDEENTDPSRATTFGSDVVGMIIFGVPILFGIAILGGDQWACIAALLASPVVVMISMFLTSVSGLAGAWEFPALQRSVEAWALSHGAAVGSDKFNRLMAAGNLFMERQREAEISAGPSTRSGRAKAMFWGNQRFWAGFAAHVSAHSEQNMDYYRLQAAKAWQWTLEILGYLGFPMTNWSASTIKRITQIQKKYSFNPIRATTKNKESLSPYSDSDRTIAEMKKDLDSWMLKSQKRGEFIHRGYAEFLDGIVRKAAEIANLPKQVTLLAAGSFARQEPPHGTDFDLIVVVPDKLLEENKDLTKQLTEFKDMLESVDYKIDFDVVPSDASDVGKSPKFWISESLLIDLIRTKKTDDVRKRVLLDLRDIRNNSHTNLILNRIRMAVKTAYFGVDGEAATIIKSIIDMMQSSIDFMRLENGKNENVKSTFGFLRTINCIIWAGRLKNNLISPENALAQLQGNKFLSDAERDQIQEALHFFIRLRSEINFLADEFERDKQNQKGIKKFLKKYTTLMQTAVKRGFLSNDDLPKENELNVPMDKISEHIRPILAHKWGMKQVEFDQLWRDHRDNVRRIAIRIMNAFDEEKRDLNRLEPRSLVGHKLKTDVFMPLLVKALSGVGMTARNSESVSGSMVKALSKSLSNLGFKNVDDWVTKPADIIRQATLAHQQRKVLHAVMEVLGFSQQEPSQYQPRVDEIRDQIKTVFPGMKMEVEVITRVPQKGEIAHFHSEQMVGFDVKADGTIEVFVHETRLEEAQKKGRLNNAVMTALLHEYLEFRGFSHDFLRENGLVPGNTRTENLSTEELIEFAQNLLMPRQVKTQAELLKDIVLDGPARPVGFEITLLGNIHTDSETDFDVFIKQGLKALKDVTIGSRNIELLSQIGVSEQALGTAFVKAKKDADFRRIVSKHIFELLFQKNPLDLPKIVKLFALLHSQGVNSSLYKEMSMDPSEDYLVYQADDNELLAQLPFYMGLNEKASIQQAAAHINAMVQANYRGVMEKTYAMHRFIESQQLVDQEIIILNYSNANEWGEQEKTGMTGLLAQLAYQYTADPESMTSMAAAISRTHENEQDLLQSILAGHAEFEVLRDHIQPLVGENVNTVQDKIQLLPLLKHFDGEGKSVQFVTHTEDDVDTNGQKDVVVTELKSLAERIHKEIQKMLFLIIQA